MTGIERGHCCDQMTGFERGRCCAAIAVVPRRLQTQAVLLIPHLLLTPEEQTQSADALLHCLRTNVWGDVCQELRVPVFAALNVMDLPPTSAGDIADMLLEVRQTWQHGSALSVLVVMA